VTEFKQWQPTAEEYTSAVKGMADGLLDFIERHSDLDDDNVRCVGAFILSAVNIATEHSKAETNEAAIKQGILLSDGRATARVGKYVEEMPGANVVPIVPSNDDTTNTIR
tara:strand:- start:108 stop:437 length:330 start_codon:yes stop_codon:yes gene_type:complete